MRTVMKQGQAMMTTEALCSIVLCLFALRQIRSLFSSGRLLLESKKGSRIVKTGHVMLTLELTTKIPNVRARRPGAQAGEVYEAITIMHFRFNFFF